MKLAPLLALVVLLAPSKPITKNIVLLVDTSGSMQWSSEGAGRLEQALQAAGQIAQQPIDEGGLLVMTFQCDSQTYPGGWVDLPSQDGVAKAETWLRAQAAMAGGNTFVCGAIEDALEVNKDDLTGVLITDGDLTDDDQGALLRYLAKGQAKRRANKLGPATVGVWGIGHAKAKPWLMSLAKAGGGGYVVRE